MRIVGRHCALARKETLKCCKVVASVATSATRQEARLFTGRIATARSAVELLVHHSSPGSACCGLSFVWFKASRLDIDQPRSACGVFARAAALNLTFENDDASDEIDVTTCSLDDPEQLPSEDHTRTSSKLKWIKLADDLPEHREARPAA
jgi:hypothetical protein